MNVINRLKNYILVDGFHVVVDLEKSNGTNIFDAETGEWYIDCYSQFASQPLGWNHESFLDKCGSVRDVAPFKVANSDMYTETYAKFVETFASVTKDFKHFFFIDGGALAVENALKAAFDWKCQICPKHQLNDGADLDVIHLKEAFHGRSGYTMSLTNTGKLKTKWFPKFRWTRVNNPKITHPYNEEAIAKSEKDTLAHIEWTLWGGKVAAIILEPIQGEGGDNHFRPEFFKRLRELADKHEALLIFDEVQTGMGLTGKWWAYQHYGVVPDLMCFGKKTQVCGFCSTERIDGAIHNVFKTSGRINSTWGGNIVDMERSRVMIEIIKEEGLVEKAAVVGEHFQNMLRGIDHPDITNVRGKGLMIALDLPSQERRDEVMGKLQKKVLALKSGDRSIRFRPCLTFSVTDANDVAQHLANSLS